MDLEVSETPLFNALSSERPDLQAALRSMNPVGFLIDTPYSSFPAEVRVKMEQRLLDDAWDADLRSLHVNYLVSLIHDARSAYGKEFNGRVFIPWLANYMSIEDRRQSIHQDHISFRTDMRPGCSSEPLLDVYRSMVSEIYDVTLTLCYACYQCIEGTYTDIEKSLLGFSEHNKTEFCIKRAKLRGEPISFFEGYSSLVRNALSHRNSNGVRVSDSGFKFMDVNRSSGVKKFADWSHDDLVINVCKLADHDFSVNSAAHLYSMDISSSLLSDFNASNAVSMFIQTPEERTLIYNEQQAELDKVRKNAIFTIQAKMDYLGTRLKHQYDLRGLDCRAVSMHDSYPVDRSLLVLIPISPSDLTNLPNHESFRRMTEMTRYASSACSIFGCLIDRVIVFETDKSRLLCRFRVEGSSETYALYRDKRISFRDFIRSIQFYSANGDLISLDPGDQEESYDPSMPVIGRTPNLTADGYWFVGNPPS